MTTATIRKKLKEYIEIADEKKIKAIYTMVEDEINQPGVLEDKNLLQELDRHLEDFNNGKVNAVSFDEVEKKAKQKMKKLKSAGK